MRTVRIPSLLHDVFGERQSPASLTLILLSLPIAVLAMWPALSSVELWRAVLAALLVADVAAGAVANVTRGTNDHYAASARRRIVFLAVHLHLPAVALLLDLPILPALVAWALTIVAGSIIALAPMATLQRPAGAMAVVVILSVTMLLTETTTTLLFVSAMFAMKVVLSFAVDHSRATGP